MISSLFLDAFLHLACVSFSLKNLFPRRSNHIFRTVKRLVRVYKLHAHSSHDVPSRQERLTLLQRLSQMTAVCLFANNRVVNRDV